MTEPVVRSAQWTDVDQLADALGDRSFFVDRFYRQKNGRGMLFVAWLGSRPAGDVYLWLEQAEELPIRGHLPRVPLLTHLEVRPDLRNRGIGTALIAKLEQYLVERGYARVALAVRTDNQDATRLYQRLGYCDWGHGAVECFTETTAPDGRHIQESEWCHVMVKNLEARSGSTETSVRETVDTQRLQDALHTERAVP